MKEQRFNLDGVEDIVYTGPGDLRTLSISGGTLDLRIDLGGTEQATAWEQGLRHALEWVGHAGWVDVMAKDNPYGRGK